MDLWKDRRLRLSLTRLGGQYVIALLMVGVFAVNTGNNLLYLIFALMLGLFLVSGWVSRRALQGIRPLSLDEGNLFARVRGGIRIRLEDRAPRRVRALEIHLDTEGAQTLPGFYAGGQREEEPLVVVHTKAEHRGWTRFRSLELRTRYPFGFLQKAWGVPLALPVLVLPHPRKIQDLPSGAEGPPRRVLARPGSSSPEGARPHRPGDAPARMHWKRTAQRDQLWVRTFEAEEPQGLHLRLDQQAFPPGRGFERELERLSGLVLQARLQKLEVHLEVLGSEGRRESSGYAPCWRALAQAEAEGVSAAPPSEDVTDHGAIPTTEFLI